MGRCERPRAISEIKDNKSKITSFELTHNSKDTEFAKELSKAI